MIPVYIITKEGRSYTTKGLNTVTDMLKTDYDISDELSFFAGSAYLIMIRCCWLTGLIKAMSLLCCH